MRERRTGQRSEGLLEAAKDQSNSQLKQTSTATWGEGLVKGAKDCLKARLPPQPGLFDRAKDCDTRAEAVEAS